MKKLLSAVTSLVTAATFVSSAFTSSFVVSAAGSVPAVQPNVSMDGVKDVTANINVSDADYLLYFGDKDGKKGPVKGNAGEKVNAYLYCEQLNDAARATAFSIDLAPDTIEISAFGKKSAAMGTTTNSNVKEGNVNAANPGEDSDGITVNGNLATVVFQVPEGTPDGLYAINVKKAYFATKTPLEQPDGWKVAIDESTAYVQVGDAVTPPETTTTASKKDDDTTTTTTVPAVKPDPANADYRLYVGDKDGKKGPLKANAGEKVNAYIYCEQLNDAARTTAFSIDFLPDTIKISAFGKKSAAMGTTTNSNVKEGNVNAANPGDDSDGIVVNGNLATVVFEVPAGTADGLYAMNIVKHYFATKTPLEQPDGWNVYLEEETAYVQVGDTDTPPATTTSSQTTTSKATDATTTTTASTKAPDPANGSVVWKIPEVDGVPGETVTLDVIVSGDSDLAVAGAQFNITANSMFGQPSAKSGNAYDSEIEYNKERNEYAFGQGAGKGTAAKDKAVILSIDYTVPTDAAPGTYPVKWSELFASDTNGLDITGKIKLENGAINIGESTEGKVQWIIPETDPVKPGQKVDLVVKVKNGKDSHVPVAGAQFIINSEAEFTGVSKNTPAYSSDIEYNDSNNSKVEIAFGHGTGTGIVASDDAEVFTISYIAPSAPGRYPVTWSESFISDTIGAEITSANLELIDGAIIVEDDAVAEGTVSWVIPEQDKNINGGDIQPGDTVELKVYVEGSSNPALAVSGAQFGIKADSLGKSAIADADKKVSATSDAYKADVESNAKTDEYAFAHTKGEGVGAKDKDNVLVITYTIPADWTEGTYPVKWSDAFISDTNGNDITDKVNLKDGSIIIQAKKAAEGEVIWDIEDLEKYNGEDIHPGDTVKVKVLVKDGDLPVGGAQFAINSDKAVGNSKATSGSAYSAGVEINDSEGLYAFAHAKGEGEVGKTGADILTFEYTIPEDCAPGKYPITWGDIFVSDTNGLDITEKVSHEDGYILIKEKETTTTTTTTTTTAPTTTTTVTAAKGEVIWDIEDLEQYNGNDIYAGDTVKVKVLVVDGDLHVGGAQFAIVDDKALGEGKA
ncbi:MAG: hypothetical protein K2J08_09680, partial [Ruminococcus sp.]|nr:hypothetical protein [Ruminococcus sp.]